MGTHHVHASIEACLRCSDDELSEMFSMDGQEARKSLLERQANGELLIGSGDCEGFDPKKGCPGHEENKVKMEVGKIYFLSFGGTEIVGRYKGDDDFCHHLFYDYLHQWAGFETYRYGDSVYTVRTGITEIREATQTEKQALLRKSIEHNTI
jgi:hypothetical protein